MANDPQSLDQMPLIRRKGSGEGSAIPEMPDLPPTMGRSSEPPSTIQMRPRDTVQLAGLHARIPEQLSRGVRLMSVIEHQQSQKIVADAIEAHLNKWNPRWKEIVPEK